MAKDLLEAAIKVEKRLKKNDMIKDLKPKFFLAGSITEGTRFGYANELDLGLRFETLGTNEGESNSDNIAFKISGDPFSLKKAETSQMRLDRFFNYFREFQSHNFKCCLLEATDKAIRDMFEEGDNPQNLHIFVSNRDWQEGRTPCKGVCRMNLKANSFKHCKICPVAVAQTKIGFTLQFLWKWPGDETSNTREIYASIDIIPEYEVVPIHAIKLASIVNTPMIQSEDLPPPQGFVTYLGNYDKHYKINLSIDGDINYVVLKEMNFLESRNHHIRPAQPSNDERKKFSTERMRKIYGYIKFLKKNVDGLDLSSFGVKKELLKEQYTAIIDSCKENGKDDDDRAVVAIFMQPEFQFKVKKSKIDLRKSNVNGRICFK